MVLESNHSGARGSALRTWGGSRWLAADAMASILRYIDLPTHCQLARVFSRTVATCRIKFCSEPDVGCRLQIIRILLHPLTLEDYTNRSIPTLRAVVILKDLLGSFCHPVFVLSGAVPYQSSHSLIQNTVQTRDFPTVGPKQACSGHRGYREFPIGQMAQ